MSWVRDEVEDTLKTRWSSKKGYIVGYPSGVSGHLWFISLMPGMEETFTTTNKLTDALVFNSYQEATAGLDKLLRAVGWRCTVKEPFRVLKVVYRPPVEVLEDYPVDVLDALSEIK